LEKSELGDLGIMELGKVNNIESMATEESANLMREITDCSRRLIDTELRASKRILCVIKKIRRRQSLEISVQWKTNFHSRHIEWGETTQKAVRTVLEVSSLLSDLCSSVNKTTLNFVSVGREATWVEQTSDRIDLLDFDGDSNSTRKTEWVDVSW
jgi:hypothetical protein